MALGDANQGTQALLGASRLTSGLRWAGVLPSALVGGLAASVLWKVINQWTIAPYLGVDPDWWLWRIYETGISNAIFGASVCGWGASRRRPGNTRQSLPLLGYSYLLAGFLLFPAILSRDLWAIYAVCAMAAGASVLACSMYAGTPRPVVQDRPPVRRYPHSVPADGHANGGDRQVHLDQTAAPTVPDVTETYLGQLERAGEAAGRLPHMPRRDGQSTDPHVVNRISTKAEGALLPRTQRPPNPLIKASPKVSPQTAGPQKPGVFRP